MKVRARIHESRGEGGGRGAPVLEHKGDKGLLLTYVLLQLPAWYNETDESKSSFWGGGIDRRTIRTV